MYLNPKLFVKRDSITRRARAKKLSDASVATYDAASRLS